MDLACGFRLVESGELHEAVANNDRENGVHHERQQKCDGLSNRAIRADSCTVTHSETPLAQRSGQSGTTRFF